MAENDSLSQLMAGLRAGDDTAATALFDRYATRLVALARSRLSAPLRQKVDAEDIAQSVFKSFFRQDAKDFDFKDWGGLWGLLVLITMRKCGRRAEWFLAGRRDIRKEIRREVQDDESSATWDLRDDGATPEEAALLTETVERLMASLDDRGREVLTLRLQGYLPDEISQQIGRTERTVYRILERVRDQLTSDLAVDQR